MSLLYRRIVLVCLLILSLSVFGYLVILDESQNSSNISSLAVSRKQKKDYNALFNPSIFKSFTIEFSKDNFDLLLTNMKDYFEEYGTYQSNEMVPVTMYYQDELGNDFKVEQVGFRTKSNTSRNLLMTVDWMNRENYYQTSFQLQFDATFDYSDQSNEYAILDNREVFNLSQLNFEYCKSFDGAYDEAMISESYSYELYRKAGVLVSNASYGIVYLKIDDLVIPYGFYTLIEPIDKEFLKKNFDASAINEYGDLYKATDTIVEADLSLNNLDYIGINQNESNIRYSFALKNNTLSDERTHFEPLSSFIENLNQSNYFSNHYTEMIDVDSFIRSLAMGFLIGNTDDYRYNYNNYYLYFEVYTNKAYYIPFDLDNSLGFGKHQDLTGNYGVSYPLIQSSEGAILIQQLFQIPSVVNLYYHYLDVFANEIFDYQDFYNEYVSAKALYEAILIEENHLGNQYFGLRNTTWYFKEKKDSVNNLLLLIP